MWATRWALRFKWQVRQLSAPGNVLPYFHPRMVLWRRRWAEQLRTQNITPALCLNYDQVWRLKFRGSKVKLWKPQEDAGAMATYFDKGVVVKKAAKEMRRLLRAEGQFDQDAVHTKTGIHGC